jgi:hypothetical protein
MSRAPISSIHRREWQRLDTCRDGEERWLDHHQTTGESINAVSMETQGPTTRIQKWIHEQDIKERNTTGTTGGIGGLLYRHITAYGKLATLGVKHESENCMDNIPIKEPNVQVD